MAIDAATTSPIPFIILFIAVTPASAFFSFLILENMSKTFASSLIPGIINSNDKSNKGTIGANNAIFLTEPPRVEIESVIALYFFAELSDTFNLFIFSAKFTIELESFPKTFSNFLIVLPSILVTASTAVGRSFKKAVISFMLMFVSIGDFSDLTLFSVSAFMTVVITDG